jgi:hypothetical protein
VHVWPRVFRTSHAQSSVCCLQDLCCDCSEPAGSFSNRPVPCEWQHVPCNSDDAGYHVGQPQTQNMCLLYMLLPFDTQYHSIMTLPDCSCMVRVSLAAVAGSCTHAGASSCWQAVSLQWQQQMLQSWVASGSCSTQPSQQQLRTRRLQRHKQQQQQQQQSCDVQRSSTRAYSRSATCSGPGAYQQQKQ